MNIRGKFIKWGVALAACAAVFAVPAHADPASCSSGNLASLIGTTCDIGNLQFTFVSLTGDTSTGGSWSASDFNFTAVPDGFALSGVGGSALAPQSISSVAGGTADDEAYLQYNVTDTTGVITGVGVLGGLPTAAGSTAIADVSNYLYNEAGTEAIYQDYGQESFSGQVSNYNDSGNGSAIPGGGLASGSGYAMPFYLYTQDASSASVFPADALFTFDTSGGVATPEPSTLFLFGVGLMGLGVVAFWRRRSVRPRASGALA